MTRSTTTRSRLCHLSLLAWFVSALVISSAAPAEAQYVQRRVVTTNGAITFIGNTLGLNKDDDDDDDEPGTTGSIGTFTTVDQNLRDNPSWPFGTTEDWRQNSSAAVLKLPPGSRVLYAELIWGGSYDRGNEDVRAFLDNAVTLITPRGTQSVAPDPDTRFINSEDSHAFYTRSARQRLCAGGFGRPSVIVASGRA
jgi:hypothetical protein